MSRENVALFVKAINTKKELNDQISRTTKANDWVTIGQTAGFDFTVDELVAVIGATVGKTVTATNVVNEFFAASNAAMKGELSQKALQAVVGGMMAAYVKCNPLFVRVGAFE